VAIDADIVSRCLRSAKMLTIAENRKAINSAVKKSATSSSRPKGTAKSSNRAIV